MPINKYKKPVLSYSEQVDLLKRRGLIIEDSHKAELILENISYYRLSAYMLPFKQFRNGKYIDSFKPNVSLCDVCNLYEFDHDLRELVFRAISEIEISLRTQLIYQLSHKYGPFWVYDKSIFAENSSKRKGRIVDDDIFDTIQEHIKGLNGKQATEIFIRHYYETYDYPTDPPAWMCVETMYLRQLLLICKGLKITQDSSDISKYYHLKNEVFNSWILSLNYVRNICAHHARLWNRRLRVTPLLLKKTHDTWIENRPNTDTVYYSLCTINYMLHAISIDIDFVSKLKNLLNKYPTISIKDMGFVEGWSDEMFWK